MEEIRIYKLAKELNTTSKRLIEKLAEIGIVVKNHMSLLKPEELHVLYKYIGIVHNDEDTKNSANDSNEATPLLNIKPESRKEQVREKKSGPVIIRKTHIVINTKNDPYAKANNYDSDKKGRISNGNYNQNKPFVAKDTDTSGLRAGFIRDQGVSNTSKTEGKKNQNSVVNKNSKKTIGEDLAKEQVNNTDKSKLTESKNDVKTEKKDNKNTHITEEFKTRRVNYKEVKNTSENTRADGSSNNEANEKTRQQTSQHEKTAANQELKKPAISESIVQQDISSKHSLKNEPRKDNQSKEKEAKKEVIKHKQYANKNDNLKSQKIILTEKKGISEILSEDFILDAFYSENDKKFKRNIKNKRDKFRNEEKYIPPKAVLTHIKLGESATVKELAEKLKKTATEVIKKLMGYGVMATLNQEVDFDTASIVADEFGVKAEKEVVVNVEEILFDEGEANEAALITRPPVVVVMGHVDHGKTRLLDAIRQTNVVDKEAGGITQHIGAYMVKVNNRNITFLDTPGHEAFTAMRARGAQITDIAILVVAADDGIMPQTIEAINHAKAANISIIVAINKIDKPGADPEKVKQELTEYGLVTEEWGGDTICVPISAKKHENIDQLLEMVLLTADMLELKADPTRQAKGAIIEAKLDKDRGAVATVLVQRGTLKVSDSIVSGSVIGRVRAMVDDKGNKIKQAGPSTPVEILGLPEVPVAGDIFYVITDEKMGKNLIEKRKLIEREKTLRSSSKVSLDDLFNQIKEGKVKELNIIVKADVQGSVEALKQSFAKLSNDEVKINIIHGAVGAVTESDISLAQVSNAIVIGFNVKPAANVLDLAKENEVDVRFYNVIYKAIEDIEIAMKGMLDPTFKEAVQGHAEIRQVFKVSNVGSIAGTYVTDGKIVRNSQVRVIRDSVVIHDGKLASLKRFKDDAKEVAQNFECGLSIEKFNDIKEGDIVESYIMEEIKR